MLTDYELSAVPRLTHQGELLTVTFAPRTHLALAPERQGGKDLDFPYE